MSRLLKTFGDGLVVQHHGGKSYRVLSFEAKLCHTKTPVVVYQSMDPIPSAVDINPFQVWVRDFDSFIGFCDNGTRRFEPWRPPRNRRDEWPYGSTFIDE